MASRTPSSFSCRRMVRTLSLSSTYPPTEERIRRRQALAGLR
jgi:hypothetical protein